jgi:hypothetical protein
MRVFKCGKCSKSYKIEDEQIKGSVLTIECKSCNAKNLLRFGVVLIATSKAGSRSFVLKEGDNLIGRGDDSNLSIKLNDKYVSRKHANVRVEKKEDSYAIFISDWNSTNGTFNKIKARLKSSLNYQFMEDDYFVVGLTKLSVKYN